MCFTVRMPLNRFIPLVIAGFIASLAGTYWDAGWHTVRGRDQFLSPPHLLLYAGISLLGAIFAFRLLVAARSTGLREALARRALRLGVLGAGVTLAAGPIDDVWHRAFGRDAVIWSPPHMLGVIGTLGIAAAVVLEVADAPRAIRRWFGPVAGAALLATCLVPVLEYDLDVPQFAGTFYLPVLALGATFAFVLVKAVDDHPLAATRTALVYTLAMGVLGLVLGLWDYPAPSLPLLIPAAFVADRLSGRRPAALIVALPAAIYLVYAPVRALAGPELGMEAPDLFMSFALACLGVAIALSLTAGNFGLARARFVAASAVFLVVVSAPAAAMAHDPGQGAEAGRATISAVASGKSARLNLDLKRVTECRAVRPVRLRARRAGASVTAPLAEAGRCRWTGAVSLEREGRWFLYAELSQRGRRLETWLPLDIGAGRSSTRDGDRVVYAPRASATTALKLIAGFVVYLALIVVMVLVGRTVTRAGRHLAT